MIYRISFHSDAKKELDNLDGSIRKIVSKQIKKLRTNPLLGFELGNKAGYNLTGFRKLYAYKKRIRIVYKIIEDKVVVYIIAIGKRDDMEVYKSSSRRIV